MKRSEMIQKVTDFLLNDISRLYPHKDQAVEIINLIEEAGMLPPEKETSLDKILIIEASLRNPKMIYKEIHRWEPEDKLPGWGESPSDWEDAVKDKNEEK